MNESEAQIELRKKDLEIDMLKKKVWELMDRLDPSSKKGGSKSKGRGYAYKRNQKL